MRLFLTILVLGAVALVAQLGALAYALYVVILVLLAGMVLTQAWTERLRVDRSTLPSELSIGSTVTVNVEISQAGTTPIPWLLVEDSLPAEPLAAIPAKLGLDGTRMAVISLKPREATSLEYSVTFHRRGYYQIGPLLVESGDLFGLHRRYRVLDQPQFVMVPPDVVPMAGYDLQSRRSIGEIRLTHRLFEDPTRITGIRDYQPGDPLNRIHWRATARTGTLQCKTFEPSCLAGAMIVLDHHRDAYPGQGSERRMELGVVLAASLANALSLLDEPVGFATNGRDAADRIKQEGWNLQFLSRTVARAQAAAQNENTRLSPIFLPARRGTELFPTLLRTLARLEPTDGLTLSRCLEELSGHLPRDKTLILIVGEIDESTSILLGDLKRRGLAIALFVVTFDETRTSDWAASASWAAHLASQGISFRRIDTEEAISHACSDYVRGK